MLDARLNATELFSVEILSVPAPLSATAHNLLRTAKRQEAMTHITAIVMKQFKFIIVLKTSMQTQKKATQLFFSTKNSEVLSLTRAIVPAADN